MSKQVIISIGREFGSGGHEIAQHLADRFSLPLYDYNLLREIAQEKNVSASNLEQYDEVPKKGFSKTVRGFNNSPQLNIAYMQFDFLKKKAAEGESFVVVGRCSEEVLKEYEVHKYLGTNRKMGRRFKGQYAFNEFALWQRCHIHDRYLKWVCICLIRK